MSSNKTMRAARIREPGVASVEEVAIPEPRENEVLFRVEGTGVCASNLGPWLGSPWIRYPMSPGESGHEAWGVVHAVGKQVRGVREGDRVATISNRAYAEYDVATEEGVVRLPPELGEEPFPGEPIGCALNIFERARIGPGQTVAVVGVGFLGALFIRLAAARGARVIAISRRATSLRIAREFGADVEIPLEDHGAIVRRVEELTHGALCDRVLEATGKQWPLDLAAEITKVRGRLVIAGYHQDGPRTVNMQLWNYRGLDVINAHERETSRYVRGIRSGMRAVLSGKLAPQRLYTHRYPLERLADALNATAERPPGFVKALVLP